MAEMIDYIVVREHQGDRITDDGSVVYRFQEGDTRTADPGIVAQLVASGVLRVPEAKRAPKKPANADVAPIKNKDEGASPDNKSEGASPESKATP